MKENYFRTVFAAAAAGVAAYFEMLLVPIAVLIVVMLCDYVSGIAAAWKNGQLSSKIGIYGIIKKVGYLLVVVVGIVIDYVLQDVGSRIGIDMSKYFVIGLIVVVWMILNECISILENVGELGVELPPFLEKMVKRLKSSVEDKTK